MNRTARKFKIIQKRLERISVSSGQKLHLGCGRMILPGFINVDLIDLPGVDLVVDLEQKLPFRDNQFEFIYSRHTLEHVRNLEQLLSELHRITISSGLIELELPHCSCSTAFSDPSHKHFFTLHSFDYYTPGYDFDFYSNTRFQLINRKVQFTGGRFRYLNFLSWLVNLSSFTQNAWERFCWFLPMENLFFTLKPLK